MRARSLILVAIAWVLAHAVACGGTAEFANGVVGPSSSVTGCEQTIRPSAQSAPAAGGSFVVEIATGPGCEWRAMSDDTWIAVTRDSGSGPGSAAYVVERNATSSARQGDVRVGDLAVSITQTAAVGPAPVEPLPPTPSPPVTPVPDNCEVSVSPPSITLAEAAGTSEIVVTTGQRCGWEATADAEWVRIERTSGVGPARVRLDVAANGGFTSRTTIVRIGEAPVRVTQSARTTASCESIRLDPDTQTSNVDGGSFKVAVSAPTDCAWTAVSDIWIAVSPGSGSGSASLSYTVAANDAFPRVGTIRIGSGILTLTQEGCSLALLPAAREVSAAGGRFSADVTATGAACRWTASTSEPWIEVLSSPGRGPGQVSFAVAANTTGPRAGRIRIGEQSIEVRQAGPLTSSPCPESVSPATASFAAAGSEAKFSVTATTECRWSASADVAWITITSGTGAGSGAGVYSVRPNDGPERSSRIRIGEHSVEIRQAAAPRACPESVTLPTTSFPAAGGESKFAVTATTDCKWSASADVEWITITPGTGAGSGAGVYSVRPNDGPERSGRIRIGERSIEVRQAPATSRPCPESVAPATASFPATGSEAKFSVSAAADCKWSASADVTWIAVTSGTGAGSGTGVYAVRPNDGPERSGRIRIGERSIEVRQAPATSRPCPESVAPATASFPATGSESKFSVTAAADCKWSASADVAWITITSGTGAGSGVGLYSVRPNDGPERSGRIRIGERSIEVRQSPVTPPSCTESVAPTTASFPATGSESKFSVTTGADCRWSASADVGWIAITSGTGVGSGAGVYTVRPNDGPERSGRIRVGERSIEIRQAAAPSRPCPESVTPATASFTATGSESKFSVTAAADCKWSAAADVGWITITSGTGAGSAAGVYTVRPNDGPERSGRIRVGERSIEIRQAAASVEPACTYSIDVSPAMFNPKGDTLTITVTTQPRCSWSMKTEVDWITPRSAGGTGSGKVGATVQANIGRTRDANIIVNDRSFTVRQPGL